MRNATAGVVGISSREEPLIKALEQLRQRGYRKVKTFSPIPNEDLTERPEFGNSPVRAYTLTGGILGFLSGMTLTIWTSLDWPLLTGGKPIASIPPYLIIAFELTILFGGLFTLAGFLIHARLPQAAREAGYDARFSVDKFGIFVPCEDRKVEEVEKLLLAAGVEEVTVEAA